MTVPTPGSPLPADPQGPEAAVRDAMAALDELAGRPTAEHVEVFERVHAALGEALAARMPDGTPDGATGRA